MILALRIYPDPMLFEKSEKVTEFNEDLCELVDNMYESMYHYDGIGLAAVQIGVLKQIIVIDVDIEGKSTKLTLINPEITSYSEDRSIYNEGCLSIPGGFSKVERPEKISVKYQDINGNTHSIDVDGLLSTCIQHEIDHLQGIVFIDRISNLKKNMIKEKLFKKAKKK